MGKTTGRSRAGERYSQPGSVAGDNYRRSLQARGLAEAREENKTVDICLYICVVEEYDTSEGGGV